MKIFSCTTLSGKLVRVEYNTTILDIVYDESGQPFSIRYKSSPTATGALYYYVLNAQGDVVGLLNSSGELVVEYKYDPWGNLLETIIGVDETDSKYAAYNNMGLRNPLRYRGYIYDRDTGLYYLQSRYYDPTIGRFINADTYTTTDTDGLLSTNMFAYCENNPVNRSDPTGTISHLVVGAAVGAVAGLAGQLVSDLTTSLFSGELKFSNWKTYVGAAVGGAAGGAVFAATGSSTAAGAASGFVTTFTSGALQKSETNRTWSDIIAESVCDGAASAYFGKLGDGIHLKGVTSGRNSFGAVYKSGLKKLKNHTVRKMRLKVMRKGAVYSAIGGVFTDLYYGVKQYGSSR